MKHIALAASFLAVTLSMGLFTAGYAQVTSPQTTTLSGQVQTETYSTGDSIFSMDKDIYKTVTLEPGFAQYSLDKLSWGDRVHLTLVNPSNVPLQFETVQRWGKKYSVVVPAHSQQQISFTHSRPFTHEVKFSVMQEPNNAIAANQNLLNQQSASVIQQTTVQESTATSTSETITPVAEVQQQTESSATVRGFW